MSLESRPVESVMTPAPESLSYDLTIGEATRLLLDEHIHGAPVVGRDGVVLGVLSSTDILRSISEKLFEDGSCEVEAIRALRQTGIGVIVSAGAVTCSRKTSIAKACRLMTRNNVHRVVVTADGVPVGVFTPTDLVADVAARYPAPPNASP